MAKPAAGQQAGCTLGCGGRPQATSPSGVEKRLESYGPDESPEKKANVSLTFLPYLWEPIPWTTNRTWRQR